MKFARAELTQVIVAKGLHDLRNKKECQVDGMLLQNTVGILKNHWFVVIPRLKERHCEHGRDGIPD